MRNEGPDDSGTLRNNLLRSTMFDEELMQNRGSAEVLSSLLKAFERHHPQLYTWRAALLVTSQEIGTSDPVEDEVSNGADVATGRQKSNSKMGKEPLQKR